MQYIAIGDSISIDEYPLRETGVAQIGAASLFYRNHDLRWPEFHGIDLVSRFGTVDFLNLTADGATTEDILRSQIPAVQPFNSEAIVTITAGGNDMLMNLRAKHPPRRLGEGIVDRVGQIVQNLRRKLPAGKIVLGTVYDPSDGTNELYGERLDREAEWLATVNAGIRALADPHVLIADIHRHFLGHGVTAGPGQRWYWSELIFEPNARGASEVRRLWLEASGPGSVPLS